MDLYALNNLEIIRLRILEEEVGDNCDDDARCHLHKKA